MIHTVADRDGMTVITMAGKPAGSLLETFKGAVPPGQQVVMVLNKAHDFLGDDIEDLVHAHNYCMEGGGSLALSQVPIDLNYVLGVLSLDQFFTIVDTAEQAVAAAAEAEAEEAEMPRTTMQIVKMERDQFDTEADPDEAAREMIDRVKVSMRYLAPSPERVSLLAFFEEMGPTELAVAEAAHVTGLSVAQVQEAFDRMAGLRVLVPSRRAPGLLRYAPGMETRDSIRDILRMWESDANQDRMMEWAGYVAPEEDSAN